MPFVAVGSAETKIRPCKKKRLRLRTGAQNRTYHRAPRRGKVRLAHCARRTQTYQRRCSCEGRLYVESWAPWDVAGRLIFEFQMTGGRETSQPILSFVGNRIYLLTPILPLFTYYAILSHSRLRRRRRISPPGIDAASSQPMSWTAVSAIQRADRV